MNYITWSALAGVFLVTSGFCQMAGISGFVRDVTGAVIQNSHIEAKNAETGLIRTAFTSASGYYRVPFLAPGSYRIAASAPGFQTNTSSDVVLHVSEAARVDFQLPASPRQEAGTITADVLRGNDSAELATHIAPQFEQALP